MGLIDWFRRTSFEGRIKAELGSVHDPRSGFGSRRLEIQELEPEDESRDRRFRFNLIIKTPVSYQALPLVLGEHQLRELAGIIDKALTHRT